MHNIQRFFLIHTVVIALSLASLPAEAACYVTCRCSDRGGMSGSETQGPFNSTAACNAAVSNMSMRCRSAAPGLMPSCGPCMNCDPPRAPRRSTAPSARTAPPPQQSDLEEKRKAQQAAEQRQFQNDLNSLKQEIKGVEVSGRNEIRLKAPPSESALHQLDCARQQSIAAKEGHGDDWTYSSDCKSLRPDVPIPSPAVAVKPEPVQSSVKEQIDTMRKELTRQDSKIEQLKDAVQAEELKPPEIKKDAPKAESDALRKAKEALAKAKAERERTAAALTKLEEQEVAGTASSSSNSR